MEEITEYRWIDPKDYKGYESCIRALWFRTDGQVAGRYSIAFLSSEGRVIINNYNADGKTYAAQCIISYADIQAVDIVREIRR